MQNLPVLYPDTDRRRRSLRDPVRETRALGRGADIRQVRHTDMEHERRQVRQS